MSWIKIQWYLCELELFKNWPGGEFLRLRKSRFWEQLKQLTIAVKISILDVCGGPGNSSAKIYKVFDWWAQWKTFKQLYTWGEYCNRWIPAIMEMSRLYFRVYLPTKRERIGAKLFVFYAKQDICHDSLYIMIMRLLNLWTVTRRYSCAKVMIGEIYINHVKNLSYLQMLFYY